MPIVNIQMLEGRSPEIKRTISERITNIIVEETGLNPETVTVIIEDMKKENFYNSKLTPSNFNKNIDTNN